MNKALSNNCLFREASLLSGGVFTCIFQVFWTCLDQQLLKFSFCYNVPQRREISFQVMSGLTPLLFLDVVAMTAAPGLANPPPASPLQTELLHILCSLGNQNMLLFLVFWSYVCVCFCLESVMLKQTWTANILTAGFRKNIPTSANDRFRVLYGLGCWEERLGNIFLWFTFETKALTHKNQEVNIT